MLQPRPQALQLACVCAYVPVCAGAGVCASECQRARMRPCAHACGFAFAFASEPLALHIPSGPRPRPLRGPRAACGVGRMAVPMSAGVLLALRAAVAARGAVARCAAPLPLRQRRVARLRPPSLGARRRLGASTLAPRCWPPTGGDAVGGARRWAAALAFEEGGARCCALRGGVGRRRWGGLRWRLTRPVVKAYIALVHGGMPIETYREERRA